MSAEKSSEGARDPDGDYYGTFFSKYTNANDLKRYSEQGCGMKEAKFECDVCHNESFWEQAIIQHKIAGYLCIPAKHVVKSSTSRKKNMIFFYANH